MKAADVGAGDLSKMDPAEKKAFFAELGAGFHGDAVAGKNAHDRAVKAGDGVSAELVKLLGDKNLSEPGRMWLAATLVDLKDDHAVEALINIIEKGGKAAYVVAYKGPAMKDPRLTAAIEKTAATTTDGTLTAWAVRGLGLNGDKIDGGLLESMLTHSDAAGRIEAADILATHPDPRAVPLLAKLITDEDPGVRVAAIRAAATHGKKNPEILAALDKAAAMKDTAGIKAADAAKSARKQLGE
jgi:HEAT repeat protein